MFSHLTALRLQIEMLFVRDRSSSAVPSLHVFFALLILIFFNSMLDLFPPFFLFFFFLFRFFFSYTLVRFFWRGSLYEPVFQLSFRAPQVIAPYYQYILPGTMVPGIIICNTRERD